MLIVKTLASYNLNDKHLFTLYNNNITRLDRRSYGRALSIQGLYIPSSLLWFTRKASKRAKERASKHAVRGARMCTSLQQGASSFTLLFLAWWAWVLAVDLTDQIIENLFHIDLVLG